MALELRIYREAIGYAIQDCRPCLQVAVVEPDALEAEVVRLNPELVICSQPDPLTCGTRSNRVQFRPYDESTAKIRIGSRYSELEKVQLVDLLSIVDEIQGLFSREGE